MNLERVSNEDKLSLCRKYYLGGFVLLPFLWMVNVIWFFREAFTKPQFNEQQQIRKYVKCSGVGLLVWIAVLTTWITVYQTLRPDWGSLGDYISFTLPLGSP
uniref:Gamma-secretase subunit PEN-2 n=1 Tax=Callorhinchus milii TaxID=7868 RepID=V9LJP6_CALMI